MKKSFLIKEYKKIVFPSFHGPGCVFHSISAKYKGLSPLCIEHTFGKDESINEFVKLGSIYEGNKNFLENRDLLHSNDYKFVFASHSAVNKQVYIKDLGSNPKEKKFGISWKKSFGSKQKAEYLWVWNNPVMFSFIDKNGCHQSLLTVKYPTKKLIFKMMYQRYYPLEKSPELIKVDIKGHEARIGLLRESGFKQSDYKFKFSYKTYFKCYKAEIKNPLVGHTYVVRWKVGLEQLAKYLGWFEANQ